MKKPLPIPKIFITAGFLSFFLFNVGSLRCESPPADSYNLQPQANRSGIALDKARDQSWQGDQEDKSDRFKELEWLIKQSLLMKYQRMEIIRRPGRSS